MEYIQQRLHSNDFIKFPAAQSHSWEKSTKWIASFNLRNTRYHTASEVECCSRFFYSLLRWENACKLWYFDADKIQPAFKSKLKVIFTVQCFSYIYNCKYIPNKIAFHNQRKYACFKNTISRLQQTNKHHQEKKIHCVWEFPDQITSIFVLLFAMKCLYLHCSHFFYELYCHRGFFH